MKTPNDFPVKAVLAFSLMEFLLLRILLRMGSFLPKTQALDSFFGFLLSLGLASLNASLAFSSAAIALFAISLHSNGMRREAFVLFSVISLGFLSYLSLPIIYASYQIVLLSIFSWVSVGGHEKRVWVKLLSLSLACTFYYQLALSLSPLGISLPFGVSIFSIGEILAVAAPLFILPSLKKNYLAAAVSFVFSFAFLAVSGAAFVPMFAVWTLYFTMILPSPVYAISLFAFIYSAISMWMGERRSGAFGLLLVGIGGRMLQNVYLTHLPVLGVLVLIFDGFSKKK